MEAERLEHVDLLLRGMPHTCAAQLVGVWQLGHNTVEERMVKGAHLFCQQIHKPKGALLRDVQGDEGAVRLKCLLADIKRPGQVLHIAGTAVEVDHVIGVLFQLRVFDRAEGHHIHPPFLRDGTHVAGGLDSLNAAAVDHALEQAAAAANGKHTFALNIAEHFLEQAEFTLKQVFILHEPSVILCRIAVKFRFHCQRVLSDFRISNLRGFFTVVFGSFFLEKLGVYLVGFLNTAFDTG